MVSIEQNFLYIKQTFNIQDSFHLLKMFGEEIFT